MSPMGLPLCQPAKPRISRTIGETSGVCSRSFSPTDRGGSHVTLAVVKERPVKLCRVLAGGTAIASYSPRTGTVATMLSVRAASLNPSA